MASVDWESSDEAANAVTVEFECSREEPVWLLTDVSGWEPAKMSRHGDVHRLTSLVPAEHQTLFYKFRIGDGEWVSHPTAPSVPDGFGGMNNLFNIPSRPDSLQSEMGSSQELDDEAYQSDDSTKTETLSSAILDPVSSKESEYTELAEVQPTKPQAIMSVDNVRSRELQIEPDHLVKEGRSEPIPETTQRSRGHRRPSGSSVEDTNVIGQYIQLNGAEGDDKSVSDWSEIEDHADDWVVLPAKL